MYDQKTLILLMISLIMPIFYVKQFYQKKQNDESSYVEQV